MRNLLTSSQNTSVHHVLPLILKLMVYRVGILTFSQLTLLLHMIWDDAFMCLLLHGCITHC